MTNQADALREQLADQEHDRWSRWMRYLFDRTFTNAYGHIVIRREDVDRWSRQMHTPYAELSEKEKDSDRKEADNTLALLATLEEKRDG